MKTSNLLRYEIRTAIACAKIYRRRRPAIARAQLAYARDLRDELHRVLVGSGQYSFAATVAAR